MRGGSVVAAGDYAEDERRVERWLGGYAGAPTASDLLLDHEGRPRPGWLDLLRRLARLPDSEIERRFATADRHIRDTGISYRIYGQPGDVSWPLGALPLVMDRATWKELSEGIAQRANLMEAILADLYGDASCVAAGLLPAALVAGNPEFLRPMKGIRPRGGRFLHLYAADVGLAADGSWRVLSDRSQAPSGAGYTLNNRLVLVRAFPDVFTGMNVERLAPFFQAFRAGLAGVAERSEPRICILSSGPQSQTYVEQAYLARYLGFLLVEGEDLIVRDGRLHVRTVAGLKRADAVWRRIDSSYVDPLALDPTSRLGVPGLLEALEAGHLVMGNMPGSGLVEAPVMASFLPALCRHFLGGDLLLRGLRTSWLGEGAAEGGRADCDEDEIVPAFGTARHGEPDEIAAHLASRPQDFVRRERMRHGTAPLWEAGRLVPRPFVLRIFAAATPEGWRVMPGAFCRIARDPHADPLAMARGIESADLWVVSDQPVITTSLLPSSDEIQVRRIAGHLPSRAADNLFWLGRYLERAEAVTRLVRCLLNGNAAVDPASRGTGRRIKDLLLAWTSAEPTERASALLGRSALLEPGVRGSAARHARSARRVASIVRERLSPDTWHALSDLESILDAPAGQAPTEADLLRIAELALAAMAALSGLAQENMNRAAGWRFLDMGRRIERSINTCRFTRVFASRGATADDLDALLELVDSRITYGSRYILGASLLPVRDMALLDPFNPRSVAFQLEAISAHLAALPAHSANGVPEAQRRLALDLSTMLGTRDAEDFGGSVLGEFEERLERLAEAIGARYFPAGSDARRPETLSGLA